jgi:hypothetical protein
MLHHVALVRTDASKKCIASIIRVIRIGELGTTLAVISNVLWLLLTANIVSSSPILVTLMMQAIHSSKTLVNTRVTWHNIPEDGIMD